MTNKERIDELEDQVLYLTKQLVKTNERLIQVVGYLNDVITMLNDVITMLNDVDKRAINDDLKMLGFIKEMMSTETNKES